MQKKVLFHRDFRALTGGHLKLWDYFCHLKDVAEYEARIYFSPNSKWDESNPWLPVREKVLDRWQPEDADIWFLAGMDWNALTVEQRARPTVPVINLVQHVRHADPQHPLYEFLRYPAIRICVSHPVAAALEASGQVNGPIRVIENGVDRSRWRSPVPWGHRAYDVLICGYKQPSLGKELAVRLSSDLNVCLLTSFKPRNQFLASLADARVAVCLPNETEGFYLPALEAMVQGALVVCPDCIGNRGFCQDGRTCWMPGWSVDALEHATREALTTSVSRKRELQQAIERVASRHSLDRERKEFHGILTQVDEMWRQAHFVEAH